MSKKFFFNYTKEIQKSNEINPQLNKKNNSKARSRNQIIEGINDQDYQGIIQPHEISKSEGNDNKSESSEYSQINNKLNSLFGEIKNIEIQVLNTKSGITTAITKAQTEIVKEIRSLGNIFQTSFDSLSKSIKDIILFKNQINEHDKNIEMKSNPKMEKENKNFKKEIKKEEPKVSFNAKKEKYELRHYDFTYNIDSAKKKLKNQEKEKLIPQRKLFNDSNSSENSRNIKYNNISLNISFSVQSDSQKDKSHEIDIKNTKIVESNSIRRKYIRKNKNSNK